MMTSPNRRTFVTSVGISLSLANTYVFSQPDSVTRLIVPFTPGAANDLIGRMFAEAMARQSGKNWIVENKAGAGSLLGADFVAKSKPDGLTLLLCATASMGVLPAIKKNMSYAVEKDFTFLARIASSPFALCTNSQVPVTNFADFVKLAKAKPGLIKIGSTGVGSLDYMGASLLKSVLGIDLNIIPYKGMSQVINDLRAGHIDASIVSPATIEPFVKQGSVKALVVLDQQRSQVLPEIPSSVDLNQPKLILVNWWGIVAPVNMSAEVTGQLQKNISTVLSDTKFLENLKSKGFDPAVLVGESFSKFVLSDLKDWRMISKQANITLDN